jgi:rhodanese-related sulfurtransferase
VSSEPSLLPDPAATWEVTPSEVARWVGLPSDHRPRLIDCREQDELALCEIPGNDWIPLGTFPEVLAKLTADTERGVVVYCHHGMRSLRATAFLRAHGVTHAFSMSGGIDEWSQTIDPSVPRY